jgi:hypothetical protein
MLHENSLVAIDKEGLNMSEHAHYEYNHGVNAWGIVAFIAFLVVIWAVWTNHNRCSDQHLSSVRAMDQVGYQAGYTQKQLNDVQYSLNNLVNREESRFEYALAQGFQARTCATPIEACRRGGYGYGHGSVINGSPINESHTFASENSAFG